MTDRLLNRLLIGAVVVSLLLGALIALRTPLFSNPDEAAHYLRSIEIAHGQWLNRPNEAGVEISCRDYHTIAARYAPMALYQDVTQRPDFAGDGCRVRTVNTAGSYLPGSYLFLAPAEGLGRSLDWPIERRLQLMRFVNFAGATLVLSLALWLVPPRHRAPFLLLAFSPMALWLRAAVSADGMTTASVLLFLAWLLRLARRAPPPSSRDWSVLATLGLLLGMCKPVYGLMVFFALVLCFRPDPRRERMRAAVVALLTGTLATALSLVALRWSEPTLIQLAYGADPRAQTALIAANPLRFVQAVQQGLGWRSFYEIVVPYPGAADAKGIVIAWGLSLLLIGLLMFGPPFVPRLGRWFAALFVVLLGFAIALPLYLTYTPPGHHFVIGVQGRYFVPLVGILMFALAGSACRVLELRREVAEPLAMFAPLAICIGLL